ncbi:MAG: hypothetical protein IIA45_12965 [Bacteroidetes bacterium]|nr:hypothetical protein [Bacteroidota bacterium]
MLKDYILIFRILHYFIRNKGTLLREDLTENKLHDLQHEQYNFIIDKLLKFRLIEEYDYTKGEGQGLTITKLGARWYRFDYYGRPVLFSLIGIIGFKVINALLSILS